MLNNRKAVKVTFHNGTELFTEINGTEEEILKYYINNIFNFGDTDDHPEDILLRGVAVEFLKEH